MAMFDRELELPAVQKVASRVGGEREIEDVFDYHLADAAEIERYNRRRHDLSATRLHLEMGPAPFDGDPYSATIVLLLNNPMYCDHSIPEDHTLHFEGWPVAGLHNNVRPSFRNWYYRPFGNLIDKYGPQLLSQRVAITQIIPWASRSFDPGCILLSRERQVATAKKALERGALVVIGRSIPFWRSQLG